MYNRMVKWGIVGKDDPLPDKFQFISKTVSFPRGFLKMRYDVIIIGAGVTGCAVARALSRYDVSALVVDRESDVCEGTSKANSAIIHAGFDALPGTLKAKLNVRGSAMMDELARDLDIPFRRNGAMVVCWRADDLPKLQALYDRGVANGVQSLRLLNGDEARALEPALRDEVCGALYAPTSGIVCPFEMTLALAENALENGVRFSLSTGVTGIVQDEAGFAVTTTRGVFHAKCVVNCAGVYADKIHDMVCEPSFNITARRGEYMLLDKTAGDTVSRTIFQLPTEMGKGVLVSPTIHGNLIVGPTALDIDDRDDTATTREGLNEVRRASALGVKDIPYNRVITSFSGLRATGSTGDFIIREDEKVKGFVDAAGIESPGLSSAPAIGEDVLEIIRGILPLREKESYIPTRRGIPKLAGMDFEARQRLIAARPEYGQIVCRCEQISEGEILDAIRRPLGAKTLDGVKRRVRAGMGRCQSGFCSPRVTELLAREQGIAFEDVVKNG